MSHPWGRARRRTLDPKHDIVFWILLAREGNRALLPLVLNAELDSRVEIQGGEQIDIEMQTRSHPRAP